MKTLCVLAAGVLLFFARASADTPAKAANFTLNDYDGKPVTLSDFKETKAIVLMFIATKCPVSNAYNDRMAALYRDYKDKNIAFLGINSNKSEPVEEIRQHAHDHGLLFDILKDVNNKVADQLEASVTPEIFVLDPSTFSVLYHGRIDDSQRETNVSSNDLRAALDEILAGKSVTTTTTKAFGCSIKRVN